ncbi:uncharacterized protein LOC116666016 isoform X2 [Camelus ferus]|uniref:Uncharacterized protein LOC116666016 isoform X2 n=1 Tax=Camelus ferus TaxID=419612 RepID=A0A8B8TNJ1_CAMFR|nr:uncharacterized protein LOC116666016 isoform X2 [Camelus ferus]
MMRRSSVPNGPCFPELTTPGVFVNEEAGEEAEEDEDDDENDSSGPWWKEGGYYKILNIVPCVKRPPPSISRIHTCQEDCSGCALPGSHVGTKNKPGEFQLFSKSVHVGSGFDCKIQFCFISQLGRRKRAGSYSSGTTF